MKSFSQQWKGLVHVRGRWNLKREQTVGTGEEGTNKGPAVGPCASGWPTLAQSQPVMVVSSSLPGTDLGMNT